MKRILIVIIILVVLGLIGLALYKSNPDIFSSTYQVEKQLDGATSTERIVKTKSDDEREKRINEKMEEMRPAMEQRLRLEAEMAVSRGIIDEEQERLEELRLEEVSL